MDTELDNFLCNRNLVLKQLPTHLFERCHEISCFFLDGVPYWGSEVFQVNKNNFFIFMQFFGFPIKSHFVFLIKTLPENKDTKTKGFNYFHFNKCQYQN